MVSEKLIIILITIAILLSIVSVAVTLSTLNFTPVAPKINYNSEKLNINNKDGGQVGLVIATDPSAPKNSGVK